ncbi:MAG: DUF3866 family protein [Bacillota bacterium]
MIRIRKGKVAGVTETRPGANEIEVIVEGKRERAINYPDLTGPVQPGDEVILNTTAVYKKLGTGGDHFVLANLNVSQKEASEKGHIMKVRYTPAQVKVLAIEEKDHPQHKLFRATSSLARTPVIIASLHSALGPVAAVVHKLSGGKARLVYLMTDGGALPISLSKLVAWLKQKGLLTATVTCGHAFGGDYEAITTYSGLLAAKGAAGADVIIAATGPGVAGAGHKFGHTALEQGELVNAVNILEGLPIAVPRISFADPRERHRGLSHHTRTALGDIALSRCTVTLPEMPPEKKAYVEQQLLESGILARHRVVFLDAALTLQAIRECALEVTTMGRTFEEDPEYFLAAGAAGIYAVNTLGISLCPPFVCRRSDAPG